MIRIIIKGTEADAMAAMAQRQIPEGHLILETRDYTIPEEPVIATLWDVVDEARAKLINWYCEAPVDPPAGGFPVGTLLHHN